MMEEVYLLGSGELGREFTQEMNRRGHKIVAVDRYDDAPAMYLTPFRRVINMNDATQLRNLILDGVNPDIIVPEIEAIATEVLIEAEAAGINVVPSARTANLTMNRKGIRKFVDDLGVKVGPYFFAESYKEIMKQIEKLKFPVFIKPIQSSSGHGQIEVESVAELADGFKYAIENSRGNSREVIVEEKINFDYEVTLLTCNAVNGITFLDPIRHRQVKGDYQESWMGVPTPPEVLAKMQYIAGKVVSALAATATNNSKGWGVFGVELFVTKDGDVYFSEVSPRPHDTGMVTLISQPQMSQFAMHAEAVLGYPVYKASYKPSASKAVVLDGIGVPYIDRDSIAEIKRVLYKEGHDLNVLIFNKPYVEGHRRCAVILATGDTAEEAKIRVEDAYGMLIKKVIEHERTTGPVLRRDLPRIG